MANINLQAAWIGIVAGMIAGAVQGIWFADEKWQGGYASWSRRMMRLGHVSFFGIGFINLALVVTVNTAHLPETSGLIVASVLLILGAALMPLVCYLSAWRKVFRHLFFLPVLTLITAAALILTQVINQ